jgi:hypothetical protein
MPNQTLHDLSGQIGKVVDWRVQWCGAACFVVASFRKLVPA